MNVDYWINRRELKQELALGIKDYDTRQGVMRIVDAVKGVDMLDRDSGKEPILETRRGGYHQLNADGTGEFVSKEYTDWMCPVCGWFVGELYSGHGMWHIQGERSYCSRCGQAIDWTLPAEEEKTRYEERKAKEREEWEKRTGYRLDNMSEGKRRKYGALSEDRS